MKVGNRNLLLKGGQVPFFVFYANAVEVGFDSGPITTRFLIKTEPVL